MEEPDIWEHCSVVGSCPGSRRCAGGGCPPGSSPSSKTDPYIKIQIIYTHQRVKSVADSWNTL